MADSVLNHMSNCGRMFGKQYGILQQTTIIIGMVLECKLIDGLSTCIQPIVDGDAFGRCFGMMRLTIVYVGRI